MKINKKIRQVTGTSKGVTFTKEELELLENAVLGDIVSFERVKQNSQTHRKQKQ